MAEDNKWVKPNRLTEIIAHQIIPVVIGDVLSPNLELLNGGYYQDGFEELQEGDTIWEVSVTSRTGLDKEQTGLSYFPTEDAAREYLKAMPIGLTYGEHYGYPKRLKDLFGSVDDPCRIMTAMFRRCDDDDVHSVCYRALSEAGVIDKGDYKTSSRVLEWLGDEHIAWMKEKFGENWSAVARFEYCLNHFPDSSLASLAAHLFLFQFVTYDDFAAGYYTKEIQSIAGGTEEAAILAKETRVKAGKAGARSSRHRRLQNLELLMQQIEQLSGAVEFVSEERIVEQALEKTVEKHEDFPKTQKTHADYGTALRSVEPFKSRYEAVFRKNA
ncbi:hypothetical protein [Ruegeria sp. HKCCA0370]|uniref:hypothetical protein n=2 Tax=unclassified Ruegeria TaxID=2625375 RepID=UPI00148762E3|nr:hypothetical protein [Ruegeria sp. HKCCA0370]